ncbi:MAG: PAS domain-containing protein [Alphaproteobacteria bacterium]|nr:PAS domain-containing protein [Alphaproteobacteria bacterium]MBU1515083.1 PAS domain-containing protein [Alphaproteobacteria bacterium]MBU2093441.1 PAS domain-containing protein [Alphaproteobacteria bacterium]MBU2152289.1 PAS domain-containing protein [Alphaproteobacteria bacterium]MBU2308103.1 PAS domain-containing protein [Alphaproteobacteria bacterium]
MTADSLSERETRRLDALAGFEILDTPVEAVFDEIAQLAADICGAPIAVVNLIARDRQFFKAEVGLGVRETPLETSFCAHAILEDDFLLVPDATKDARFEGNPLVTAEGGLRFYAGALLKTDDDLPIGTLCVLDTQPRTLTPLQERTLRVLAHQVMSQLNLRQALRHRTEDEARYRVLFDTMDEGFCIIEFFDGPHGPLSDYVHVEANAAYARHAGIPDVVGQKLREMVGDEADSWVARYGGVLRTGEPIRFEQELVATGRHLALSAFRLEPPSRKQVAVLFQDVTARRRAEQALVELNQTLEARVVAAVADRNLLADIVEGTHAFVQVADKNFRLLAINGAAAAEFERVFGVRPKVGDNLLDLLADQPANQAAVRASWGRALAGESFVEVSEFGDQERDRRFYELRFDVLRDADGRDIGAYQFVYDVTERLQEQTRLREAEEALRQAQKMEAVGQLTGGLAHDFNNLLAGVSGAFEMIGTRLSQGRMNDVERYLGAGQGAARRAAALTHRLLAFSRRQTLSPKPLVVNRLMADLAELVRRTVGPSIEVETIAAGGLWPTLVDPNQLENAILNLCINARDAMPGAGKITIETGNKWLDRRSAAERGLDAGQYVTICVSDTGTGIEKSILDRVFDPFFTTKPMGEGTGLGLSMVYGFARQSHGHVRIYSEVGQGTMVCIYLPRFFGAEEADVGEDTTLRPATAAAGETVLIIDDEPTIRMLIVDALGELGYACAEAEDGPGGLAILQSSNRIDLLITDVGLPGGLNGRQVADAARVLRPDLKVLFITGYAENAVLNHGHIERGMEVITKPFAINDLATRVERILHQGSGQTGK